MSIDYCKSHLESKNILFWLVGIAGILNMYITLWANITDIAISHITLCLMFIYHRSLNVECESLQRMGWYFIQNIRFQFIDYSREIVTYIFISARCIWTGFVQNICWPQGVAVRNSIVRKHIWDVKRKRVVPIFIQQFQNIQFIKVL